MKRSSKYVVENVDGEGRLFLGGEEGGVCAFCWEGRWKRELPRRPFFHEQGAERQRGRASRSPEVRGSHQRPLVEGLPCGRPAQALDEKKRAEWHQTDVHGDALGSSRCCERECVTVSMVQWIECGRWGWFESSAARGHLPPPDAVPHAHLMVCQWLGRVCFGLNKDGVSNIYIYVCHHGDIMTLHRHLIYGHSRAMPDCMSGPPQTTIPMTLQRQPPLPRTPTTDRWRRAQGRYP